MNAISKQVFQKTLKKYVFFDLGMMLFIVIVLFSLPSLLYSFL
jgi:hypothetical protein